MKKLVLFAILSATICLAKAQTSRVVRIDQSSIVTDSSGARYPYEVWHKLMETNQYTLRRQHKNDSVFVLIKLDSAQMVKRMSRMEKPRESENFPVGTHVDLFTCTDINGNKLKAADLKGKIVVLNFWFIGCPPCRKEIPELNEIALKYTDQPDVVFIAVALDERYKLKDFLQTSPLAYHVVDDGHWIADRFSIHLFPTNAVIDKDGNVRFSGVGYAPNTAIWIKNTIAELQKGG